MAQTEAELELARKNMRWGWALFVLFWGAVQFAGTVSLTAPLAETPPAPTV